MEQINIAYKASDGTVFESLVECKLHESKIEETKNVCIEYLLRSVRFAEISEIKLDIFNPIFLNKILLVSADSMEDFNEKAKNMNVIVIKTEKMLYHDNLNNLVPNGEFKEVLKKIQSFSQSTLYKEKENLVFYKINNKWYGADELLDKTKELYKSIARVSNICLK